MTTLEEWKRRGRELAEAVAPVVGIALRCESGDSPGMDAAAARACLEPSVLYFRSKNKEALATSIERLIDALDRGTDAQVRGAEVMQSLNASYPRQIASSEAPGPSRPRRATLKELRPNAWVGWLAPQAEQAKKQLAERQNVWRHKAPLAAAMLAIVNARAVSDEPGEQQTPAVYRLVRTADVTVPIFSSEVSLRIETFQCSAKPELYRVRLFRYESFRMQPSFPQLNGTPKDGPSDELILKEFESFFPAYTEPQQGHSAEEVEQSTLDELQTWCERLQAQDRLRHLYYRTSSLEVGKWTLFFRFN